MSSEENRLPWIFGGIAGLLLGALWLTGALSAAIFGSGWAPVQGGELPLIAARLLSHLEEPSLAWPKPTRGALPGAVAFYLTGLGVLGAMAAAGWSGLKLAGQMGFDGPLSGGRRRAPSARWATRRDLGDLRISGAQPGRLTLGRFGRSLIAAEAGQSVIAIAPTQSFKTTGLAIPALLEWSGPVVATSVKSDLLLDTFAHRGGRGEVMVFDPAQVTSMVPRTKASPLWGATNWRGAMRVAHWLASAARTGSGSGLQDADFWFSSAEKLLAPLLFAAAANSRSIGTVVRWLDEGPESSEDEVIELLEKKGEVPEAKLAYLATQNRDERQRSSVYTTAETVVAAFADPRVDEETAVAEYSPATLLDGGAHTLYLCAPLHEQERLRVVFSMIVQELLAVVYETVAATGKPLDPPLLLLLDEAANIAPLPNHDEIASTAAGHGVQLLSIFQDLAQINARYGRRASTVVNNHRGLILGSGISDPDTLNLASRLIGAAEFEQRSRTAGEQGRRSTTEGNTYRDLMPGNVLRELELGTAVLIYGHRPPIQLRLRPYFREASLRRLTEASPGGTEAREV